MTVAEEQKKQRRTAAPIATGGPAQAAVAHSATEDTTTSNMAEAGVSAGIKVMVTIITIVMLASGVALTALFGDLGMRPTSTDGRSMSMPQ